MGLLFCPCIRAALFGEKPLDSRLKMSGMTEGEAGGTVWGKARGFPIKDVGNDRGAITNGGHDGGGDYQWRA